MDWQGALRARLAGAAPVAALVGTRIYWDERPQGSLLPAIVLQDITEEVRQNFKGVEALQMARVQIDVWALLREQVRPIRQAVIDALLPAQTANGVQFERSFVDRSSGGTERSGEVTVRRASIDLIIHHKTA